jgi:excisionase family DNA binding protein
MMTIEEAAEVLRTSPRALYMRIRRGAMPGVVRIGSRRLMVKTDEFLRELHRMPTFE